MLSPKFQSSTRRKQWLAMNSMMADQDSFMFEINVPVGCPYVASVTEYSAFPGEDELLIFPYSMVRVVKPPRTEDRQTTYFLEFLGIEEPGADILKAIKVARA